MHTQHNFCTQQLRYVGITRIVILFGLNLCAGSRENSFQDVLKAVLFGVGVYLQQLTFWLFCGRCHSSEDLDQALQAYQAYQVPCPQDSTMTPERSINHHYTYHIAQASQAKYGSLIDRGANGGLAGSDVRIPIRVSTTFILCVEMILFALARISNNV